METILVLFGITALLLLLSFAFFGVKMIFKKNGEFKRACGSVDPKTGERKSCHCSGQSNDSSNSDCKNINPENKENKQ